MKFKFTVEKKVNKTSTTTMCSVLKYFKSSFLCNMSGANIWTPETFFNCDRIKRAGNYAVIVLNRPINADKDLVESLWNHGENNS